LNILTTLYFSWTIRNNPGPYGEIDIYEGFNDIEQVYMRIYFFSRNAIPADIVAGKPDPSKWGIPAADFDSQYGGCDIDANFPPQTIVSIDPVWHPLN
jgi:hypothetical protein